VVEPPHNPIAYWSEAVSIRLFGSSAIQEYPCVEVRYGAADKALQHAVDRMHLIQFFRPLTTHSAIGGNHPASFDVEYSPTSDLGALPKKSALSFGWHIIYFGPAWRGIA
jgi:hypothetical protein